MPNDGAHAVMGLNLYSTSHDEIDPGSIGVAEHFAFHAGLALGQVRREAQLRTAIGTRTTIGTAIGILMERHTLSQESAFAYLVRLSSTENRKVRVLASEIVEQAERGTMARNGVDVRGTHGSVHEPGAGRTRPAPAAARVAPPPTDLALVSGGDAWPSSSTR